MQTPRRASSACDIDLKELIDMVCRVKSARFDGNTDLGASLKDLGRQVQNWTPHPAIAWSYKSIGYELLRAWLRCCDKDHEGNVQTTRS